MALGRYFSPQLYTQGSESTPDFTEATGTSGAVEWSRYKNAKFKFVPSIVSELGVDDCKSCFSVQGLHVGGQRPTRRSPGIFAGRLSTLRRQRVGPVRRQLHQAVGSQRHRLAAL